MAKEGFQFNNFDREYSKSMGVPYQYRGNFPMPTPAHFISEVRYGVRNSRVISRDVDSQKALLNWWCSSPLDEPMLIGFGSDVLDTNAMRAATLIARYQGQTRFGENLRFHNCASLTKFPTSYGEPGDRFYVLYNITPDMTRMRLQTLRDVITSNSDAIILLVIAGCPAAEFINDYLKLSVSYALHFGDY